MLRIIPLFGNLNVFNMELEDSEYIIDNYIYNKIYELGLNIDAGPEIKKALYYRFKGDKFDNFVDIVNNNVWRSLYIKNTISSKKNYKNNILSYVSKHDNDIWYYYQKYEEYEKYNMCIFENRKRTRNKKIKRNKKKKISNNRKISRKMKNIFFDKNNLVYPNNKIDICNKCIDCVVKEYFCVCCWIRFSKNIENIIYFNIMPIILELNNSYLIDPNLIDPNCVGICVYGHIRTDVYDWEKCILKNICMDDHRDICYICDHDYMWDNCCYLIKYGGDRCHMCGMLIYETDIYEEFLW